MERSPQDAPPSEIMDAEETFHNVFFYFIAGLRILAMEPEAQCEAQGNYNVAQELQQEALSGRYLVEKGRLNKVEETAIEGLASSISELPKSVLTFANGHEQNVLNMERAEWTPIRAQAASLLKLLIPRIVENNAYFERSKSAP
jgi:hypothetical protein